MAAIGPKCIRMGIIGTISVHAPVDVRTPGIATIVATGLAAVICRTHVDAAGTDLNAETILSTAGLFPAVAVAITHPTHSLDVGLRLDFDYGSRGCESRCKSTSKCSSTDGYSGQITGGNLHNLLPFRFGGKKRFPCDRPMNSPTWYIASTVRQNSNRSAANFRRHLHPETKCFSAN